VPPRARGCVGVWGGGVFYYYLAISLSAYGLVCVFLKRYSRISKRKYSFLSLDLKCEMYSP